MEQTKNITSTNSNQTIEDFIQRVTEFSQFGRKIPTAGELEKIASEVGISPEEIAMAQEQSQAHFLRAKGYCNLKHWDDAIAELQEGLSFNPYKIEMIHLLIDAYLGRWQESHKQEDEEEIKRRVKQCLEIQPNDEECLKKLQQLTKYIRNRQVLGFSIGTIVLLTAGTFIGIFVLNNASINIFSNRNNEIEILENNFQNQIDSMRRSNEGAIDNLSRAITEQGEMNYQLREQLRELESQKLRLENENKVLSQNNQNLNQRLEIIEKELKEQGLIE